MEAALAALPAIPAKRYFTIGEVSELCLVKPYVLRYWEQEFSQLRPMKRRGNRRYYQHHEVLLVRCIRELLYDQGFTISGARNRLATLPMALPAQAHAWEQAWEPDGLDEEEGLQDEALTPSANGAGIQPEAANTRTNINPAWRAHSPARFGASVGASRIASGANPPRMAALQRNGAMVAAAHTKPAAGGPINEAERGQALAPGELALQLRAILDLLNEDDDMSPGRRS